MRTGAQEQEPRAATGGFKHRRVHQAVPDSIGSPGVCDRTKPGAKQHLDCRRRPPRPPFRVANAYEVPRSLPALFNMCKEPFETSGALRCALQEDEHRPHAQQVHKELQPYIEHIKLPFEGD